MKKRLISDKTPRLEKLLCQAAEWEPGTEMPQDLVRRALQPRAKKSRLLTPPIWAVSGALAAATVALLAVFHPLLGTTGTNPTPAMRNSSSASTRQIADAPPVASLVTPRPQAVVASAGTSTAPKSIADDSASQAEVPVNTKRLLARDDSSRRILRRRRRASRHSLNPSITVPERELPAAVPLNRPTVVAEAKPVVLVPIVVATQVPTEDGQGVEEVYTPAVVAFSLNTTGSGTTAAAPSSGTTSTSMEPSPTPAPTAP